MKHKKDKSQKDFKKKLTVMINLLGALLVQNVMFNK